MKQFQWKRLFATVLAVSTIASMTSVSAFADEGSTPSL